MNPCKDCIVDMICIQKCPNFEIDLERLQTDELTYLRRCMNNHLNKKAYEFSNNIRLIMWGIIRWSKNGKLHRDNDQPAIITYDGSRHWYKNGKYHRDNDKPAVIQFDGTKEWWKDGVQYEPM